MNMKKITVGFDTDKYPQKRNIIGIVDDVRYVKAKDLFKAAGFGLRVINKINKAKSEERSTFVNNSFYDFNLNNIDLFHFFNTVSYGKTPWISTFETFIPRYTSLMGHQKKGIPAGIKTVDKALSAIASDACKRLIALSECTRNFQLELLEAYPQYKNLIEKKLTVIHPPQRLYIHDFNQKGLELNHEISFIFVGGDFFRKGGLEVLRVFEKLRNNNGLPVRLTIVSSLSINDYATKAGEIEYQSAKEIIDQNEWITHFDHLPNDDVLRLMEKHHVGLLPTWADTYGYSLLEMQATGCPVISTNIRALPEINDNQKGWIIEVPKNSLGEAYYSTEEMRNQLSATIADQLENIVRGIMDNTELIPVKSQMAINNIKDHHSLEHYADQLRTIYEDCL
jgi:glycosyltransferase involved in cell wall biosynthesis